MENFPEPDNRRPVLPKADGPRRGFINPLLVRSISFTVISLCLLFCTVISILAVWDFIERDDLIWRAFSTLLIVGLATWVFNQVNERFGA
ncbi:MAG: hypothetical protein Q7T36_04880 [Fluviicoccus sp.]|uniref:hypothetical protein n=1 Tax=Fluviicoccus sp. TaxID=2003552 RepID=UPI002719E5B2|nr:hypothetical protein [Fluviicoccus sp.]MDO8329788.1 hypothetical protein [Fluviicoccus sp.]